MKKLIRQNAWAFYLGACMPYLGVQLISWTYVIVMLPTIILVAISQVKTDENENI